MIWLSCPVLSCPLSVTIAWIIKSQLPFSLYRTRASVCGSCSNWFSSCRERYKGLPECLVSLPYCYCKLCREKVWNSCMVPNSWKLCSEQNQVLYKCFKAKYLFYHFLPVSLFHLHVPIHFQDGKRWFFSCMAVHFLHFYSANFSFGKLKWIYIRLNEEPHFCSLQISVLTDLLGQIIHTFISVQIKLLSCVNCVALYSTLLIGVNWKSWSPGWMKKRRFSKRRVSL